jgi:hypothetical protein
MASNSSNSGEGYFPDNLREAYTHCNADAYAPNADGNCDCDSPNCHRVTDTVRAISYSVAYPYGNSDSDRWAAGYARSTASA